VFDNKLQHDAQEMLRFVLMRIQACAASKLSKMNSASATSQRDMLHGSDGAIKKDCTTSILHLDTGNGLKRAGLKNSDIPRKISRMEDGKSSRRLTDFFHKVPTAGAVHDYDKTGENLKERCGAPKTIATKKLQAHPKELDFISRIFQGELVSQLHCYDCDSLTRRPEAFLDISVPVSSQTLPGFQGSGTPVKSNELGLDGGSSQCSSVPYVGPFSLSWALSQFCYREKLFGENKYKCETCNHLVEAEKTLLFRRLPLVMTVHLNRFTTHVSYSMMSSSVSVSKIAGNLAIPTSLCLSAWCTQDCENRSKTYQLFGVVFHTGSSCSSGHYTACVRGDMCRRLDYFSPTSCGSVDSTRHNAGKSWYYFDDEIVDELSVEEVVEMLSPVTPSALSAYILFYTIPLENC